jgi:hypothetical protein
MATFKILTPVGNFYGIDPHMDRFTNFGQTTFTDYYTGRTVYVMGPCVLYSVPEHEIPKDPTNSISGGWGVEPKETNGIS